MSLVLRIALACACLLSLFSCSSNKTRPKADVVIWHWMTDRQATFEKLAAAYEQQTGIRVAFETYAPSEVYKDKIRAAASGKLLPEVFSVLGDKRELSSYINANYVADLTADFEQGWKDRFFAKPLLQATYAPDNEWKVKPGIYGVPIDVNAVEIYYNKDLFRQAGLDPDKPPRTWDEFIAAGRKLRAAGIHPFVSGFGEAWMIGAFAQCYEWNLFGKDGVTATIQGKIPYTDPRWQRVYGLFDEMRRNGLFASGVATLVNKDAERLFAIGKAAMAFNGSWGVNVYYSMNPNLDYGVMLPPKLRDARFPVAIFGGEGSSFMVNPRSPNRDKAVAFLKWLTDRDQQALLAAETRNIPSNKDAANHLPPLLKQFADDIPKTFDPLPVIEDWRVTNALNTELQSILIGEKTPAQAAQEVQAEKSRQEKAEHQ